MVNEQEETATSSNVSASDGSKNDEKYSNNRMIISEKEIASNKASSSFSCSMGLESNLKVQTVYILYVWLRRVMYYYIFLKCKL